MGENIRRRSFSPLPNCSETTPQGYRALSSSQMDPSLVSLARVSIYYDLGQPSIPTPSVPNHGYASGAPIYSTIGRNPQPKLFQ